MLFADLGTDAPGSAPPPRFISAPRRSSRVASLLPRARRPRRERVVARHSDVAGTARSRGWPHGGKL